MKRATIFYLWAKKNAGDIAICLGAISLLKKLGFKITFISRFSEDQADYKESKSFINNYHKDVLVKPGPFSFDRGSSVIKRLMYYFKGTLQVLKPYNKTINKIIDDSDIVFLNGGNLLRSNNLNDLARLVALFYPFGIAKKLNKTAVVLPHSTNQTNRLGIIYLIKKLRNFDKIMLRESISYSAFLKYLPVNKLIKTIDLAFFIEDNDLAYSSFKTKYEGKIYSKSKSLAIVLRATKIGDIGELNNEEKDFIVESIINLINDYKKRYCINLIIQTKKDAIFTKYVYNMLSNAENVSIVEETDPYLLRELYRNMDIVLSMRLHALIMALSVNTPVVGFFHKSWGYKNPGIMDDIGMPWSFKGENIHELIEEVENNMDQYVGKIKHFIAKEKIKMLNNLSSII